MSSLDAWSLLSQSAGWIGCWVALVTVWWRITARARSSRRTRREPSPEGGFDYTVNLMVILPLWSILLMAIVETSMVLCAKLGTSYATYAAARSWLAWEFEGELTAQAKAEQAVWLAMAPFGLGLVTEPSNTPVSPAVAAGARAWAEHYGRTVRGPVEPAHLERLYARAARQSRLTVRTLPRAVVAATLVYRYPVRFQLIGRLLGTAVEPSTGRRVWPIETTISLTRQEPLDVDDPFGITYHPEP